MATVEELLTNARAQLATATFSPPQREASLLLSRVLGCSEARILSRGEAPVDSQNARRFRELVDRRLTGEPVAYLLGEKEFFGRLFRVDSRVLVPRPETEHLVEAVLEMPLPTAPRILDLGTGSGCLAVTLACELDGSQITAIDTSAGAIAVARGNASLHSVSDRISFLVADLATSLDTRTFDLVVSNPPYVDPTEPVSIEVAHFEPESAVFAVDSGLSVIRRLLTGLSPLAPGTPLVFEIGAGQASAVGKLLSSSSFELLELRRDLAAKPRIVIARRR